MLTLPATSRHLESLLPSGWLGQAKQLERVEHELETGLRGGGWVL